MRRVLVVVGEPSGDRAAAAALRGLRRTSAFHELDVFGIGGDALAAEGVRLFAHVRDLSGMGIFELSTRLPAIASALSSLRREVARALPDIAVLASWSSANGRIGAWLRKKGVRVVWISPPEIWAWGAFRAPRLARAADVFAVTLPFEEAMWREAGAHAVYVGHPSLDVVQPSREEARRRCELADDERAIAVLPGSRPSELQRLLPRFLDAITLLGVRARVIEAPSIPIASAKFLRATARAAGIEVVSATAEAGALCLLPAFDAALVASGTVSLECAFAGVPPVIAYAMSPWTMAVARRVVRTPYFALPNVVLGRAAFPELLQERASPENLARALEGVLASSSSASCAEVRERMGAGGFEARVAQLCQRS